MVEMLHSGMSQDTMALYVVTVQNVRTVRTLRTAIRNTNHKSECQNNKSPESKIVILSIVALCGSACFTTSVLMMGNAYPSETE